MSNECKNCPYCWLAEDEKYERCHWTPKAPGEMAPCESQYDDEPEDYREFYEFSDEQE